MDDGAIQPGGREWWLDRRNYLTSWNRRARVVSRFCRYEWVCDIGCGMQGLDRYLPLHTKYLPADLKPWTSDVEVCDLNAGLLPERYLALCDVATLLGVVERINDLDWLFASLATRAERLVVTYHCADKAPNRLVGWINAYDSAEFAAKLTSAGYSIEQTQMFRDQTIFVARNLSFGDERKRERDRNQNNSAIKPSAAAMVRRLIGTVLR